MPNETVPGLSVIKDPIPDAALPGADDGKFDFDFEYLASKPDSKEPNPPVVVEDKPTVPDTTVPHVSAPGDKPNEAKPGEQVVPDTPVNIPDTSAEVSTLKTQLAEAQAKLTELNAFVPVYDEFKKSPEKFIFKHVPALAEKISPDKVILDKLKTEFGPDFRYDASEAYMEGTQSYDYRVKFEELKDDLTRERTANQMRAVQEQERVRVEVEDSRKKVMASYKLNDAQFKTEIEDYFKGKRLTYEDLAKLRFFNDHIAAAVKKATAQNGSRPKPDMPQSPASVPAGGDFSENDPKQKEFHDTFGD